VNWLLKLLSGPEPVPDESALVEALRARDERAFTTLVDAYGAAMLRVAQTYVRSRSVAEEVVQEAWVGVLRGIDGFEGRSSLKTWIFRILTNIAKTRGKRESRTIPFSALEPDEAAPSVDPDRFFRPGDPGPTDMWAAPPESWRARPEERLLATETRAMIDRAIEELPRAQRVVITLRDVEGFGAEDVCNVLEISETNQRVLLHRARSKVRAAIEDYLREDG
jgi:RNA polymerase sigma-70 factor (ECF subfamily)